jgi:hypothetical protein
MLEEDTSVRFNPSARKRVRIFSIDFISYSIAPDRTRKSVAIPAHLYNGDGASIMKSFSDKK